MESSNKKHIHHGRSTRDIIDPNSILNKIGLKKGDIFLDAGCGDGYISIAASSFVGEHGRVYALDIYEKSIEEVKREIDEKGIKNIVPLLADLTNKIPINDSSVDVLLMANVLHGFVANNEIAQVMKEVLRVLKKDGALVIVEFKKPVFTLFRPFRLLENIKLLFVGPPMSIRLSPKKTAMLLKEYGFTESALFDAGRYHYGLVASLFTPGR